MALLGGGEFSFEETEDADAAWLERSPVPESRPASGVGGAPASSEDPEAGAGPVADVGFLPAASGSEDYANHFAVYLDEYFERSVHTIPVYRGRDGRRGKNAERIARAAHVYVGGGVADHLIAALADTPCEDALRAKLATGGTVVAIAAGAQSLGEAVRSLFGGKMLDGMAFLPGGVVETNFEGKPGGASDRRLRQLLAHPHAEWGLALAAGAAVLLGPDGEVEVVGEAWSVDGVDGELVALEPTPR